MTIKQDIELSQSWTSIAESRRIEARHTRGDRVTELLESAANAQRIADGLRREALEALFWRARHPTEAEKRALGLDDVLWPEQLKSSHRERVRAELAAYQT